MKGKELLDMLKNFEAREVNIPLDGEIDFHGNVEISGTAIMSFGKDNPITIVKIPIYIRYKLDPDQEYDSEVIE